MKHTPKLIRKPPKSTTCSQLDLETLGLCHKITLGRYVKAFYYTIILILDRVEKQMTKKHKKTTEGQTPRDG